MSAGGEREVKSLGAEYPKEQARLRELIRVYRELPGGVGAIGATLIEHTLQRADAAAISGDPVAMIRAYQDMRGCE